MVFLMATIELLLRMHLNGGVQLEDGRITGLPEITAILTQDLQCQHRALVLVLYLL